MSKKRRWDGYRQISHRVQTGRDHAMIRLVYGKRA